MRKEETGSLRYDALGASADKDGLHTILDDMGVLSEDAYFCQLVDDVAGNSEYKSFIHCDGAGTKTIVPYLWYKETGSTDYFGRLAADALVMNLDDVFCLGKVESLLLANAIARNSSYITEAMLKPIIENYYALGKKLSSLSIPIIISGGETADCGDTVRSLIVDATLFGRIKKNNLINPKNIQPGDIIVSFASFGKASYEDEENSGIGSNGLTLARHALLGKTNLSKFPEVGNPILDDTISYQGPYTVTDTPKELVGMTIGNALSSPTRTFSPILQKIFSEIPTHDIHGIIHLTGGAHGKALRFIPDCRVVKDSLFTPPPLFSLIQEHGRVPLKEMYRVFNMGQRMDIYCPESHASTIIQAAKSFNVEAKITGFVEASKNKEIVLKAGSEEIIYN
jgi:phosphoribosylformylglycinamidine cyclo-ligase